MAFDGWLRNVEISWVTNLYFKKPGVYINNIYSVVCIYAAFCIILYLKKLVFILMPVIDPWCLDHPNTYIYKYIYIYTPFGVYMASTSPVIHQNLFKGTPFREYFESKQCQDYSLQPWSKIFTAKRFCLSVSLSLFLSLSLSLSLCLSVSVSVSVCISLSLSFSLSLRLHFIPW